MRFRSRLGRVTIVAFVRFTIFLLTESEVVIVPIAVSTLLASSLILILLLLLVDFGGLVLGTRLLTGSIWSLRHRMSTPNCVRCIGGSVGP